jgi:hypothetical protein
MVRGSALAMTVAVLLAGCQHSARTSAKAPAVAPLETPAVVASALVFDPPVIQNEAPLELSRADREARVSLGYQELTAEYFYIRLDDRQTNDSFGIHSISGGRGNFDRYERRAVTERVGVRYR